LLGVLDECRNLLSINRQVHQHRWGWEVIVPLVTAMNLVVPASFSGLNIQGQDAASK